MIGNNQKALKIYQDMATQVRPAGNRFVGYVGVGNNHDPELDKYLQKLGEVPDLIDILSTNNIEEVIIALENS